MLCIASLAMNEPARLAWALALACRANIPPYFVGGAVWKRAQSSVVELLVLALGGRVFKGNRQAFQGNTVSAKQ